MSVSDSFLEAKYTFYWLIKVFYECACLRVHIFHFYLIDLLITENVSCILKMRAHICDSGVEFFLDIHLVDSHYGVDLFGLYYFFFYIRIMVRIIHFSIDIYSVKFIFTSDGVTFYIFCLAYITIFDVIIYPRSACTYTFFRLFSVLYLEFVLGSFFLIIADFL